MEAIRFMMKYVKRNPVLWSVGLMVPSLANLAANLSMAYGMEAYTAELTKHNALLSKAVVVMLITLASLLISTLIEDMARYLFAFFITKTENNVKQDLYIRLISTRYDKISKFDRGELFTRYNADASTAANLISKDLFAVLFPVVLGTGYLISIFSANILIGFIMLTLAAAVILLNVFFVKKSVSLGKNLFFAKERFTQLCDSAIQGKMSLRQLTAESLFTDKMNSESEHLYANENEITKLNAQRALSLDFCSTVCSTLMAPLACVFATLGWMTLPSIVLIAQLCRYLIQFTNYFGVALTSFGAHSVSYGRLRSILDLPDENTKEETDISFTGGKLLEFKDVGLSYGENKILDGINFSIEPGRIFALVGASGSGKSSIVKALMNFIDYSGEILVCGINSKDLSPGRLRKYISYVPEQCELFDGSVLENITCAASKANQEEISKVLFQSALNDEPDFLLREVGEGGSKLSGGQRQRVAIARALFKDAPVIIFDEPTASLDAISEGILLGTITDLKMQNKGVIIITHRASTMKIADKILLIRNKSIINCSSPEDAIEILSNQQKKSDITF